MDRLSRLGRMARLLAALRVVLVAVSLCLLGVASRAEVRPTPVSATDSQQAHADNVDYPAPSPAIAEERDEEPREGAENDVAHSARAAVTFVPVAGTGSHLIRGPPAGPRGVPWRPRSSRGPPAQV